MCRIRCWGSVEASGGNSITRQKNSQCVRHERDLHRERAKPLAISLNSGATPFTHRHEKDINVDALEKGIHAAQTEPAREEPQVTR